MMTERLIQEKKELPYSKQGNPKIEIALFLFISFFIFSFL